MVNRLLHAKPYTAYMVRVISPAPRPLCLATAVAPVNTRRVLPGYAGLFIARTWISPDGVDLVLLAVQASITINRVIPACNGSVINSLLPPDSSTVLCRC